MASLVLADSAVVAAAAGVSSLVRQLWPARRKWVRPLAAVAAALTATALAATGRRVPVEAAGILLAAVVAGWLTVTAGHAWSRVATAGWRALRPRRKVQSHLYIWADGVAGAAMTAYIGRQLPGPWIVTATSVLLGAAVGSIRLGRTRQRGTVALWTRTRRPTPPWHCPGVSAAVTPAGPPPRPGRPLR
jgi:hypothetical protein